MRKAKLGIFILSFFAAAPLFAKAEIFVVDPAFDISGRSSLEADIKMVGEKGRFFVERKLSDDLSEVDSSRLLDAVDKLSKEFDSNIYPKLTEVFGSERTPGIDGDSKVAILLHETKGGVGGYVRERDGYAKNQFSDSNAREMVYIDVDGVLNSVFGPAFLAHEFQHLITFNQKTILRKVSEERWLDEARSEYAPTLLGYNNEWRSSYLKKRTDEFLGHPSDALVDWRGRSIDHASANLFIHFLADKYGVNILTEMMKSNNAGIESINDAIKKLNGDTKFEDIFRDWSVAAYVNNTTLNNDARFQYKFPNLSFGNLHVLPSSTFRVYDNNLNGANFMIDNWSAQWHKFEPGAIGEESSLHIRILAKDLDSLSVLYVVNDFFGGTNVHTFNTRENSILTIPDFGNFVSSVVVIPILIIPGANNVSRSSAFSLEGFVSNSIASRFAEGALIRAKGDTKVFIVKNGNNVGDTFVRWVQSPIVFAYYNHLKWNDIIEVKPEFLLGFKESYLIRRGGDYKVYEIDKTGKKKWLDMPPAEFEAAGYKWDAVYEINDLEFSWYK